MTNQTPIHPGIPWAALRRRNAWSRWSPLRRASVVTLSLALPCGGAALQLSGLTAAPRPALTTAPGAGQLAGDRARPVPAATTRRPIDITVTAAAGLPAGDTDLTGRSLGNRSSKAPVGAQPVSTPSNRELTKREVLPFATRTIQDDTVIVGEKAVRTAGVVGVRTTTYRVTLIGGHETSRKLLRSIVTKQPVTKVVVVGSAAKSAGSDCNPNYSPCVPNASDVDCAGGSGSGPVYVTGPIRVIGEDVYHLDRNGDAIGCADE